VVGGILLTIFAGWSLAWIFTYLGTRARSAQAVQGISMLIMFPLTFLSNIFANPETMPEWLQTFVSVNPVTLVVNAIRDLMNDGQVTASVGWAVLGCAIVAAIFLPLSVRSYSRKM
jgi:ABC-2 type transport system permease protein